MPVTIIIQPRTQATVGRAPLGKTIAC